SGFDCSGLVSWVYGRLGGGLPHNAAALYGVGHRVGLAWMRRGALVFFSGLGHVGLYIGHGRMIHAPQSGRNVEIEALGSRSLPPRGARRITLRRPVYRLAAAWPASTRPSSTWSAGRRSCVSRRS